MPLQRSRLLLSGTARSCACSSLPPPPSSGPPSSSSPPATTFHRTARHSVEAPPRPAFSAGSVSQQPSYSPSTVISTPPSPFPASVSASFSSPAAAVSFNRRYVLEAVAAFAVVALLFLPLARSAWTVNSASSASGAAFAGFLPNLWRQLHIFTVWYTGWPSSVRTAATLFFALLVLAGLLLPGDRRRDARPLLWLWIGAPLLIGSALLATNAAIFREDRYFIFLAPFVLWAAARGVSALGRWQPSAGALSGLAALALLAASLPVLWTPPLFRENWRAAADYISAYQEYSPHADSAALVHPYFLFPALDWYLRQHTATQEMPVYGNFNAPLTPEQAESLIAAHLQNLAAPDGADTLWLVQSHLAGVDDHRLVQSWLDGRYPLVTEQYPAGVEMRGYAVRYRYQALPALSETAVQPQAQLFPGVELTACEITTPAVPRARHSLPPAQRLGPSATVDEEIRGS